jgi:hypothetical protein
MNEGGKYLQNIIDARPEGVRRVFAQYGITAEPTPEAITNAYEVFGKPFVGDMVNALVPRYDSAEGDALQNNAAQAEQKKSIFDNIVNAVNSVSNVLVGWGIASGKGTSPAAQTPAPAQAEKNNTLLFLGIGLAAVILLAVIIIVKSKR